MIKDDPALATLIFGEVGSRFERYYQTAARLDYVGACVSNDDWGFKTQTLFSPADMRRFVFPWHKRIVAAIHAAGKPAILHSCGHFERVIEDIIVDMGYDGRHSYEDAIMPVEEAYERYGDRIAILGGIDVDFICRSNPAEVYQRAKRMLARASSRGSYALGTGNSVPEYVPDEGYFAMLRAAWD
jgi:uroporphyrinogen decarboxylase